MSGWLFQSNILTDCGDLVSDAAILEVTATASISTQPSSVSICEGSDAGFLVVVSGSNAQYQWQVDDGNGFQNISDGVLYSGTLTDTLTVLNLTILMSGWLFQNVILTDCGDLVSDAAILEVTATASISTQPSSVSICEGSDAGFLVVVSGSNAQYQWQVDDGSGFQDISDGVQYTGTLTDTLTVLNPTILMSGWLFQSNIVTDCGDLVSDAAILEVLETATISNQPVSINLCEGASTGFSIGVIGSIIQFQWQVDEGSGFINLMDNAIYSNTNTAILSISMVDFLMNPRIILILSISESICCRL